MLSILLAAAAVALSTPQAPPPAAPEPDASKIVSPHWVRKPTGADMEREFPVQARRKGLSGRARIKCLVRADGTLQDCTVLTETPAGKGFGDATVRLGKRFKMTSTVQGQSVGGGSVVIPVTWVHPNGSPPPPDEGFTPVAAQGAAPPPLQIPPPPLVAFDDESWVMRPTAQEVEASRPPGQAGRNGEAVLSCRIEKDGAVTDCWPHSETPEGSGFAAAAMTLSGKFQARPLTGYLIRSAVRIRIPYAGS